MSQHASISRRQFVRRVSGAGAAIAMPYFIPSGILAADGKPGPNDQIGIAGIGIGRRGVQVLDQVKNHADARIIAIADANLPRAEQHTKRYGGQLAVQNYHELLERSDIDAIVTATPDHWRALVSIHAAQAGKDIYAEKPMTLTILEGRRMAQAVRKHDRVFQTGSQQRSDPKNLYGCELVRNHRIGKITRVEGANYPSPWNATLPSRPVPAGLDWNMWCGPTASVPYHVDLYTPRANPGWISFAPYSGGEMTGWGAHGLDQIQWALGMDETGPVEIWVDGDRLQPPTFSEPHSRRDGETQCSQPIIYYKYANGIEVKLDGGNPGGAIFYGEKGKIEIFRSRVTANPAEIVQEPIRDDELRLYKSSDHVRNWLDCIKSRKRCIADVESGHRATTVAHLGNIARLLGRKLNWDPDQEIFPGDDEANSYIDRDRRKGYELPTIV